MILAAMESSNVIVSDLVHPISDTDRLPLRLEGRLMSLLGMNTGYLEICSGDPEELPTLRCVLPQPVAERVSLVVRVHSRAGIPLASVAVEMNPGDQAFETPRVALLAMEGYAHLNRAERRAVERRVWSRRAFATGSLV